MEYMSTREFLPSIQVVKANQAEDFLLTDVANVLNLIDEVDEPELVDQQFELADNPDDTLYAVD